jgi:propane monooxygenase reductase subunit
VLTSSVPIQTMRAQVASITALTHDIRHLALDLIEPQDIAFHAGQYVDIQIPGTTHTRAFSMANTPATEGRLEFMIKLYPGGRFSGLLEDQLAPGDELEVRGPYGVFILREHSDADLVFIGGGAGMAPIWSLLNSMAERGLRRKVTYYYGARSPRDLFHLDELAGLGERLPDFRFVPALSEPAPGDGWEGETGLITDVVDRLESDLTGYEGYLCGPPPMIDAAIELLVAKGIGEARIFYDKFTITASEEEQAGHQT